MWQLNANSAAFAIDSLAGSIDSTAPSRGLQGLSWKQTPLAGWSLLGITAPLRRANDQLVVEEQYVRGRDLVVDYQQVPGPNVQPQCYWRLHQSPGHGAAGIEVILSLRTSLLASRPESQLVSALGEESELLLIDAEQGKIEPLTVSQSLPKKIRSAPSVTGLLLRPQSRDFSYAEFIIPSDCAELDLEPPVVAKSWRWQYTLFREHLEKGVIRRGRVQAWFLPRSNDVAAASELCAAFLNSPAPLTT